MVSPEPGDLLDDDRNFHGTRSLADDPDLLILPGRDSGGERIAAQEKDIDLL